MVLSPALSIPSATDYLRQARRLRAKWSLRPARLHHELRQLAQSRNQQPLPSIAPGPAERFSQSVAAALDGPVLRYSARLNLLKQAARLGIERFEANLLIAAVQHRAGARWDQFQSHSAPRRLNPVWFALLIQALLLAAAFLLFR